MRQLPIYLFYHRPPFYAKERRRTENDSLALINFADYPDDADLSGCGEFR